MPASRRTSALLPWGPIAHTRRRTRHSGFPTLNIREYRGIGVMTWGKFGLTFTLLLVATLALVATVLARDSAPASAQQVETSLDAAICTNGTVIPDHANKADLVTDCENLVAAVNHWRTNTTNQRRIPNWAADKEISTWEGIAVSGTAPRITGLDLNSNALSRKLRGRIPPELGSLSELRSLNLSWNYLGGEIPSSIWTLTKLTSLNLEVNSFRGSPPGRGGEPHRVAGAESLKQHAGWPASEGDRKPVKTDVVDTSRQQRAIQLY